MAGTTEGAPTEVDATQTLRDAFTGFGDTLVELEGETEGKSATQDASESSGGTGKSSDPADATTAADPGAKGKPDGKDAADPAKAAAGKPGESSDTPESEVDDDDPLKGSEPFKYKVNGEERAFEGAHRIPGEGLIFTEDAVPKLQLELSRAATLEAQNRELYQRQQAIERLGGSKAIESLTLSEARHKAAVNRLAQILQDPEQLTRLVTEEGELDRVKREIALDIREAENKARTDFTGRATEGEREAQATEQTTTAITNAVATLAREFTNLTDDDLSKAQAHFARVRSSVVRPATPEEAREAGVKVGESVIDLATIRDFLSDRNQIRSDQKKTTEKVESATRENAARLAATRQPRNKSPRSEGNRATTATATVTKPAEMSWSQMRRMMQAGKFPTDVASAGDENDDE
jgi:hypothetical protein